MKFFSWGDGGRGARKQLEEHRARERRDEIRNRERRQDRANNEDDYNYLVAASIEARLKKIEDILGL